MTPDELAAFKRANVAFDNLRAALVTGAERVNAIFRDFGLAMGRIPKARLPHDGGSKPAPKPRRPVRI